MSRFVGPVAVIGVVLLAIFFASQNGTERVTLDFGLFVLYGVPVSIVAFGGLFLGMVVMLGAGIQSDLKVRAILRQRLAEESEEDQNLVDSAQQDLFLDLPPQAALSIGAGPSRERAVESEWSSPAPEVREVEAPAADEAADDLPSIQAFAPDPAPDSEEAPPARPRPRGNPVWRDMEY